MRTAAAIQAIAAGVGHALAAEHLQDLGDMSGMEYLLINGQTTFVNFTKDLRWNDMYYRFANGFLI